MTDKKHDAATLTIAAIFAWLLPGAGHWCLGERKKGVAFFLILSLTYLMGLWLADFRQIQCDERFYVQIGSFGSAATLVMNAFVITDQTYPANHHPPLWYAPGMVYMCVVGLLNILITLSIFSPKSSTTPPTEGAPSEQTANAAQPADIATPPPPQQQIEESK